MFKINFNFVEVKVDDFKSGEMKSWLKTCLLDLGYPKCDLTYVFVSDDYLYKMNMEYLNHDTYTDIITFELNEKNSLSGEMYISVDRVYENAIKYKVKKIDELRRVMIHGVLHLSGHGDKTRADKLRMRGLENKYITL